MKNFRLLDWFIFGCLTLLLACNFNHSASGQEDDLKPVRNILVDADVWASFNWAAFDQDKIISYGNYQYTVYWDADMTLAVVRRDFRNDEVQTLRLEPYKLSVNPNDRHRDIVIGLYSNLGF